MQKKINCLYYMQNALINQCLLILKRDDIKKECKNILSPVVNLLLVEIYPYLYFSLFFVVISLILHLGILYLIMRRKTI